jgi:hypothetical protein
MAKVKIEYGIGFSQRSGAAYFDLASTVETGKKYQTGSPVKSAMTQTMLSGAPWSCWGKNNLLGKEMAKDIKETGILTGIIEGKARYAIGQGMVPVIIGIDDKGGRVIEKYVNDQEILEFLDMNNHFFQTFAWVKDYVGYHNCIGRLGLNSDYSKIVQFQRDDISEARYEKKNAKGRIENVYYSAQWEKVKGYDDERVLKFPLLSSFNPTFDLQEKIKNGAKDYWYAIRALHPGWDEQYYPIPNWMSVYKWVKIAQSVPEMKAAIYENTMRAKYIVIIQESYWANAFGAEWKNYTDAKKEEARNTVFDEIDEHLVGSKNAGKAIFTTGYKDRDGKIWADIDIKLIDDPTKQGEYLPDSAAANSEIAFAMLWNLAMTGGNQASGLYESSQGGSNVRESILMQVILHEVERQQLRAMMNPIKYFNGWNKKHQGLDFIIPNNVLTTTDTGGGFKQVNGGSNNSQQQKEAA